MSVDRSRTGKLTFAMMIFAAVSCVILAACGGTEAATQTLTEQDIAGLVLPVDEIVVNGTTLEFSEQDSGAKTREGMLDGSFDRERDTAELDEFGWTAGQHQLFRPAAADDGFGVLFGETSIDLLDSNSHAKKAAVVQWEDLIDDVGKKSTTASGTTLQVVDAGAFEVEGIEGARGVTARIAIHGEHVYFTIVSMARGPLLVSAAVAAYDNRDLQADAERMAKQLEAQVATVVES